MSDYKEMNFICFIIPRKVKTAMSELDVDFNDTQGNSGVMLNIISSEFSVMSQIHEGHRSFLKKRLVVQNLIKGYHPSVLIQKGYEFAIKAFSHDG